MPRPASRWLTLAVALALLGCRPESAPEPESPSAPLRRLSNAQYLAALADLFPQIDFETLAPTLYLSSDPTVDNFVNAAAAQTPNALLVERHQQVTMIVAGEVARAHADILACDLQAEPLACGLAWIDELGPRAWRRPLTVAERERLHDSYADELALAGDPIPALQLATQRILLAPEFVYLIERGRPGAEPGERIALTSHEQATRLALLLWNTIPDPALLAAADGGELQTTESLLGHAREMLADPRARGGVLAFYQQWLEFDRLKAVQDRDIPLAWLDDPDQQYSAAWDELLVAQFRVELEGFVLHNHFEAAGTLAGLLRARESWLSPQLARHYGVDHPRGPWIPAAEGGPENFEPAADDWLWLELPSDQRAGVLTRAGSMAMLALDQTPSPIRRGVYLLENFLCAPPGAPPAQIDTTPPSSMSEPLTNRERFAAHTDNPACSGCHAAIDTLGFGFEHYDQTGFFRTLDAGFPVDASGEFEGLPYAGALELAERLASSEAVHRCVASKWWQYTFAGVPSADASAEFEAIADEFWRGGGRFEDLLLAIIASEEFRSVPEVEP